MAKKKYSMLSRDNEARPQYAFQILKTYPLALYSTNDVTCIYKKLLLKEKNIKQK